MIQVWLTTMQSAWLIEFRHIFRLHNVCSSWRNFSLLWYASWSFAPDLLPPAFPFDPCPTSRPVNAFHSASFHFHPEDERDMPILLLILFSSSERAVIRVRALHASWKNWGKSGKWGIRACWYGSDCLFFCNVLHVREGEQQRFSFSMTSSLVFASSYQELLHSCKWMKFKTWHRLMKGNENNS